MYSNLGTQSCLPFVNHLETYGPTIIEKIVKSINCSNVLDIGAGNGRDLTIVKKNHSVDNLFAVDFRPDNHHLANLGCTIFNIDIEKDELPISDCSLDLVIANQVMEHIKEIYLINHQIFKKLAVGGYFIMGVPNLLAFHNRILSLFGFHPTCIKLISAHIRGYSIRDTIRFYESIGKRFLVVEKVYGSQFYPFSTSFARLLSAIVPSLSTSIFFKIKKIDIYHDEFRQWTQYHFLETKYFTG